MSEEYEVRKAQRARRRAAGICIDCPSHRKTPAFKGGRCRHHHEAIRNAEKTRSGGPANRVPTFEDFERLEDSR